MLAAITDKPLSFAGLLAVNVLKPGSGGGLGDGDKDAIAEMEKDLEKKSVQDAFLDIGRSVLPDNVVEAFVEFNVLGVVSFFLMMGVGISIQPGTERLTEIFDILNKALMRLIETIIKVRLLPPRSLSLSLSLCPSLFYLTLILTILIPI